MDATKPVTNNTLRNLLICVVIIGVLILGMLVMTKETVQVTASSDGSIMTGEIKRHWKFKGPKQKKLDEPKS